MERQLRMGGGIMNIVPREEAFLGGLKKAIKGVAKGIGSFVKSDFGKAALLGAGAFGLAGMGPLAGLQNTKLASTLFGMAGPGTGGAKAGGIFSNLFNKISGMSLGKKLGLGAGIAALGSGIFEGMNEQEVEELKSDPKKLRNYLNLYFTNLNPDATQEEIDELVERNMFSSGGRIGYRFGGGYQGSDAKTGKGGASKGRSTSARDRAMGSGGKQRSGTNTSSIGGGNNRRDDSPQQTITRRDRFDTSSENIVGLPTFAEFGFPGSKSLMDRQMLAELINFQNLPQAGEKFDPSFKIAFFGPTLEKKFKEKEAERKQQNLPTGTKGAFVDILGGIESGAGSLFEENVGELFEGVDLGAKSLVNPFAKVTPTFTGGGIDIDKSALEDKARQALETLGAFRFDQAEGGRIGYARGDSAEDNAMQAAGVMGLPLNQNPAGITELDLRETGGFIPPVGVKEKADDIPAMLSNNEFVFTADAVRGMGDGDVNKGAQRMYDMMKRLENGGRV